MPDGVETGALARSLRAMTFGTIRSYDERRKRLSAGSLQELDHQFQVPIAGQLDPNAHASATTQLDFEAPLLDVPDERQSPYSDPLFTYGVVLRSGPPIGVFCAVRGWLEDSGYYTGAVIVVDVVSFETGGAFKGEVHANFQGYGAPDADDDDQGEDES